MGAFCCSTVPSHSIEAEDSPKGSLEKWSPVSPLSTLLKLEDSEESLLGLDYAQWKQKRTKGFCEFNQKRLLSYTSHSIYLSQLTDLPLSMGRYLSKFDIQRIEGKVQFCSFTNHHKSNSYVVLLASGPDYFVQSYEVSAKREFILSEETTPTEKLPSKSSIYRVESAEAVPNLKESTESNLYLSSELKNQIKLAEFTGKPIQYTKMVKNIAFGHSELLLATEGKLATLKIKQFLLLDLCYQQFDRLILSIEYWGGFYIFLHSFNVIGIYKRTFVGDLVLVKYVEITSSYFDYELSLRLVKCPALEWSERLVEVLHKQFPRFIILCGNMSTKIKSFQCLIKFDLCKEAPEVVRLIPSMYPVTCINFGPYDNGLITLGFLNGQVHTYDYYRLKHVLQVQAFSNSEVKGICFEPCKRVLVGGSQAAYSFDFSEQMLREVKRVDSKTNLIFKF